MNEKTLWNLIEERMSLEEVLDLSGVGINELCLRLRGPILERRERFESYLDIYDEGQTYEDDA